MSMSCSIEICRPFCEIIIPFRKGIVTMKHFLCIALLMITGVLFAQTTRILIYDSNGNQTSGTIDHGNISFHDSAGNATFGTIRGGNVFLNTSKGEITFGTIKDGNIFLMDSTGANTGTIRNGNIFMNNSNGSITTGMYDRSGNASTTTTGARTPQSKQQDKAEPASSPTCIRFLDCFLLGAARSQEAKREPTSNASGHSSNSAQRGREEPDIGTTTQTDAQQAHDLMEQLRQSIVELQRSVDHNPIKEAIESHRVQVDERDRAAVMASLERNRQQAIAAISESKSSWATMRKIYCRDRLNEKYIDLDGNEQSCEAE